MFPLALKAKTHRFSVPGHPRTPRGGPVVGVEELRCSLSPPPIERLFLDEGQSYQRAKVTNAITRPVARGKPHLFHEFELLS